MSEGRHGDRVALADPPAATDCADLPRDSMLACLTAAIDCSGLPRKAIAIDCGLSEQQLSKTLGGLQGLPPDFLDRLPRAIRVDFLRRLAVRDGAVLRDVEPWEAQAEVIEAADELCRRLFLLRAVRCRAVTYGGANSADHARSAGREGRRVA